MKRGGPITRQTRIRRRVPIRPAAVRRGGLWLSEREELKRLHRRVVMTRWAARCAIAEVPNKSGPHTHWEGNCLRCRRWRILAASHIKPVGRVPKMRYDSDNAVPLCGGCHIHWWHKYPDEAAEWIKTVVSAEVLERLRMTATSGDGRWPSAGIVRIALSDELRRLGAPVPA